MNFVSIGILVVSSACLTLGAIHLRFWTSERGRWDHLAFAFSCFSVAVFSWFEMAMLHATSVAEYSTLLRWTHVPAWAAIISIAWFVRRHLRVGRLWLFWLIFVTRTVELVLNIASKTNLEFVKISSMRTISFAGESLSIPVGEADVWMALGPFSLLLFLIYCVDGAIVAWLRGDRRKALAVGGSVIVFASAAFTEEILSPLGAIPWPFSASFFFVAMVIAMGFELNADMHRAAKLTKELDELISELKEREKQLGISADAGKVGIWTKNVNERKIWASPKWFELFGLKQSRSVTFDDYLETIHPDDRERVEKAMRSGENGRPEYEVEYRTVLPNGELRWISSLGKVEFDANNPTFLRGASVDITKRKLAEDEVRDLSGRLIKGQEEERARLARELHDDLSQRLALLSINLQMLSRESQEPELIKEGIDKLTEDVGRLSSDMHRISHELHPAKLEQFGLESAIRSFCREVTASHGLEIDFSASSVPRSVPNDAALSLYRIAQESLQNIVKHSGASRAKVELNAVDNFIGLTVSDDGSGFDVEKVGTKDSIGLIGMNERIRHVKGTLSVESQEGNGTKIHASVPMSGDQA